MKTYLVTGGAGFIGSNFIHYILKKYDDIFLVNLDKLTYAGNLENLKDCEQDKRYTFIQGDICDYPETSFEKGIRETIDWYQQHKVWMKNVTSGEYEKYYNRMYGTLNEYGVDQGM